MTSGGNREITVEYDDWTPGCTQLDVAAADNPDLQLDTHTTPEQPRPKILLRHNNGQLIGALALTNA